MIHHTRKYVYKIRGMNHSLKWNIPLLLPMFFHFEFLPCNAVLWGKWLFLMKTMKTLFWRLFFSAGPDVEMILHFIASGALGSCCFLSVFHFIPTMHRHMVQVQFLKICWHNKIEPGMNLTKQVYMVVTSEQYLALETSAQTSFTWGLLGGWT